MTLAIDGKSFPVQDDRDIKDNLKDAVGKQTVFVITSGKVSYAMPLERVSTRLEAVATVEPSTITYQGGYDLTSVTAKVEVQNVYDVDSWVDKLRWITRILRSHGALLSKAVRVLRNFWCSPTTHMRTIFSSMTVKPR